MTIQTVDRTGSLNPELYAEVAATFEGRLLVLALENESVQKAAAEARRDAARAMFIEESKQQADAMRAEADSIEFGAWTQATISVYGAAIGFGGIEAEEQKVKDQAAVMAGFMNGIDQPVGKLLGDAPAARHRAAQVEHGALADLAEGDMSAAAENAGEARDAEKQAIAWLSSVLESDAQANAALLDNIA